MKFDVVVSTQAELSLWDVSRAEDLRTPSRSTRYLPRQHQVPHLKDEYRTCGEEEIKIDGAVGVGLGSGGHVCRIWLCFLFRRASRI